MSAVDGRRIENDPPRLLHRRSELAYTALLNHALHDEPEAVPEPFQQQITHEAQRREREQRVRAWAVARVEIASAVTTFASSCRVERRLGTSLHALERTVARITNEVER